jgi:uncharacterized membrane protein
LEALSNFHPYIVHFPIALLVTYFLFELMTTIFKKEYLLKAAHLILLFGVIGAFGAVLTGNQAYSDYNNWQPVSLNIYSKHQMFANITTWYFSFLLIARTYLAIKKKMSSFYQIVILVLAAIGIYFVLNAGYFGGQLVNKFGVNKEFRIEQNK